MRQFFILFAVLTIAIVGTIVLVSNHNTDSLFEANVEALSDSESGGEFVKCYCKTGWFSPKVCSVNGDGGYCGGDPCSNHDGNCR